MPFYTYDNVPDSPINNFATLNPLNKGNNLALSEGNLKAITSASYGTIALSTIGVSTGKWYIEGRTDGLYLNIGIIAESIAQNVGSLNFLGGQSNSWCYAVDGNIYNNGTAILNTGNTYGTSDVVGLLLDLDSGNLYAFKNGNSVYSGNAVVTGLSGTYYLGVGAGNSTKYVNFGQDPTFGGAKSPTTTYPDANGLGQFYYEPPAGALALCTQNLPEGYIKLSQDQTPSDNFKAVTYTGNGGTDKTINCGFSPDLLWFKQRTDSGTPHRLMDTVRGVDKSLATQETAGEFSYNYLDINNSTNDITLKANTGVAVNSSNKNYVAWCWRAAGAPANNQAKIINEDGSDGTMSTADLKASTGASITPSKVSANRQNGFSIVKYTGNSDALTNSGSPVDFIPHGLNSAPEFFVLKDTSRAGSWNVGISNIIDTNDSYLRFNEASSVMTNMIIRADSNVIQLDHYNVENSVEYICYAWHSVEGYSKIGSYTGNGSTDGPFVYTGFRPAFVLAKPIVPENWSISDSARSPNNQVDLFLRPDEAVGETSSAATMDFLSNGFKIRTSDTKTNGSNTIMYMAFAEQPFSGPSNAR